MERRKLFQKLDILIVEVLLKCVWFYGRSFRRWAFVSLVIVLAFSGVLYAIEDQLKIADHNTTPKLATMLYFSVVTFTTLGFGNVTPKTLLADIIVVFEVILGWIMLAALILIFGNKWIAFRQR